MFEELQRIKSLSHPACQSALIDPQKPEEITIQIASGHYLTTKKLDDTFFGYVKHPKFIHPLIHAIQHGMPAVINNLNDSLKIHLFPGDIEINESTTSEQKKEIEEKSHSSMILYKQRFEPDNIWKGFLNELHPVLRYKLYNKGNGIFWDNDVMYNNNAVIKGNQNAEIAKELASYGIFGVSNKTYKGGIVNKEFEKLIYEHQSKYIGACLKVGEFNKETSQYYKIVGNEVRFGSSSHDIYSENLDDVLYGTLGDNSIVLPRCENIPIKKFNL